MDRSCTIRYHYAGTIHVTHAMPRRSALALAATMRDLGLLATIVAAA